MTPEQIGLVRTSFAQVVPIREPVAELFYGRLFELDPSLRPLFKGDMKEQGIKLMAMIGTAVGGLDNRESLDPALRALGQRNIGYGVAAAHYDTVASALLWTLERSLGAAFTADVRAAWIAAYGVLAGAMIDTAAA
ncbi:MAG: hemin receptor [Alphaproteobacteria bacterium]|nr:hemin receptor [Alphaproteobacteria bacterium]